MGARYNAIAGQSVERLAALSDGLFAVAMTLLVLDLKGHSMAGRAIESDQALLAALAELLRRLMIYLMSFLTLGIFWVGQQTQLSHFARSDRHLTWIHLAFLFTISLMPFSTALMAVHHAADGSVAVLAEHPGVRGAAAGKLALTQSMRGWWRPTCRR